MSLETLAQMQAKILKMQSLKDHLEFMKSTLALKTRKERFTAFYTKGKWRVGDTESGPGSTADHTANLRTWLPGVIAKYDIKRIVDAPCGDFNWMKHVLPNLDVDYHGLDIVENVIARNEATYGTNKITFSVADICEDSLPACDLLIVRDCLFHLSFKDIDSFLANIAHCDYRYLLTTSHVTQEGYENRDISSGGFRRIELFKPPFCFAERRVIDQVDDYPEGCDKPQHALLFAKEDVPLSLST